MLLFLSILWFVWELKYILFWLYLWQLKDYHIGRFIDHFRTYKGKKLLVDYAQAAKLFLLLIFIFTWQPFFVSVLILIYLIELALVVRSILNKSFRKPVITLKTIFLTLISFGAAILLLKWTLSLSDNQQSVLFLEFDILTPLIISFIVLFFQPFFVLLRNNTLRKARIKMEQIKAISGVKVVAITGSYGKTSTKEFLSTILSKKFKVLSTKEHQNSEIGVAKCILNDLKPSHQIFIAEVGAYNKGKVKEVCSVLKPSIGIVTGVNEQHIALFGSMENLLSAEGGFELAESLGNNGILIVNGDNKFCLDLYKKTDENKKVYSISNKTISADIWSDQITVNKNYISFLAIDKSGEMANFYVNILGKQNVQNLLGAILTAKQLGMTFGEIAEACKQITQEQAGMVLRQEKHGLDVVDASYSSNPDGVFADLDYFSVLLNKKVIVMPCLIELGKKSTQIHEEIGKKIAEVCDMAIITTKDKFEELKKGAVSCGMAEKDIVLCDNSQDIYAMITLFCKSGDAVLLEGRVPGELIKLLS